MDRGTILRVGLPLVVGLWGLGWLFQFGPGPHGLARSIGLLLGLIGLAAVILSRYTLGRSYSVAPKATALVTCGIYSRIRNPIYVSGVIFLMGLILIVGWPKLMAVLLGSFPCRSFAPAAKPQFWKQSSATFIGNTASAPGSEI